MWNRRSSRAARVAALAATVLFAFSATAMADKLTVRLTADGQKTARAAVAGNGDFAAGSGWVGKALKPDLNEDTSCAGAHPKQSDLVLTGKAETLYKHKASGWQIHTSASVLRTPKMVAIDWKRTAGPALFLACLRSSLAKASKKESRFVSVHRRPFPQVGEHAEAFRALFDVTATSGKHVSVMVDFILASSGRTELTLVSTAEAALAPGVEPAEVRLARLLVKRAAA